MAAGTAVNVDVIVVVHNVVADVALVVVVGIAVLLLRWCLFYYFP